MAKRRYANAPTADATSAMEHYLLTGEYLENSSTLEILMASDEEQAAAWATIRARILREWISRRPGTRPWAWWRFDAPRWRRQDVPQRQQNLGDWAFTYQCEPRQRVGGTGTVAYEVFNLVPEHKYGLPTKFVSAWDEAYFNGRAKDIHGNPIGTEYRNGQFKGRAIDPRDPPRYESQAAYLDRHGLLTESERRRLTDAAFEPETVIA